MSIRQVVGLPGSGKSYYMTRKLAAMLIREWRTKRGESREFVVSLDIDRSKLAGFLEKNRSGGMIGRVQTIQKRDGRLRRFWLLRGNMVPNMEVTKESDDSGYERNKFRLASGNRGVVYILDEAQFMFRARDYAKFSGEALDYLSYHEHLGDEVWLVTQAPEQMDIAFTRLTEEFIYLQNTCRGRFFGWFRGPKQMVANHYMHLPERWESSQQTEVVRFSKEVAMLYRTSEMGDRGENDKQGLHWSWGAAAVAGIAAGLYWGLPLVWEAFTGKTKTESVTSVSQTQPTNSVQLAASDVQVATVVVQRVIREVVSRVVTVIDHSPVVFTPYSSPRTEQKVTSVGGGNGVVFVRAGTRLAWMAGVIGRDGEVVLTNGTRIVVGDIADTLDIPWLNAPVPELVPAIYVPPKREERRTTPPTEIRMPMGYFARTRRDGSK